MYDRLFDMLAKHAAQYHDELAQRGVYPPQEALAALDQLGGPLPEVPSDPQAVVELLARVGAPTTVATNGGRYFGFVTGAALPATMGANWLAGAWDQNGAFAIYSPLAARIEAIVIPWLLEVLGLPDSSGIGFVSGATTANFSAILAARHAILARAGWDVTADGLFGAPEIKVVVGDEVHVSLLKALSMAGLGQQRVLRVPVDGQGRMRADALPELDAMTIVCVQAGNVNTGAFDPAGAISDAAHEAGAWVHVDGAFGLWAAAAPQRAHLAEGLAQADSWATDAHKWLNVPYDCGLVFVRDPHTLRAAMAAGQAAYLIEDAPREPFHFTPEMSRRARGIEIWAALKSLGRSGLAEMIERNCQQATRFAAGLRAAGYAILNDVVLNQVLVAFGDAETTNRVIAAIQEDGACWCGGTVWQGRAAMRISVSSWATTDADVERCLAAMLSVAAAHGSKHGWEQA